jgi:hypothetical protein
MMMSNVYPGFIKRALSGDLNLTDVRVILMDTDYEFDVNDEIYDDVIDYELSGDGYTVGGIRITASFKLDKSGRSPKVDLYSNYTKVVFGPPATFTTGGIIYYDRCGYDVDNALISYAGGGPWSVANGSFSVVIPKPMLSVLCPGDTTQIINQRIPTTRWTVDRYITSRKQPLRGITINRQKPIREY